MEIKQELEAIARKQLNLPDNAVITRASFQITDKNDEITIIGSTAVEYQDREEVTDLENVYLTETSIKPRTKRGRKEKKEYEPKTPPLRRAQKGEGKEITEAQIKGWRATLWARQNGGLLTKEQIAAVNATKGTFARNMTPEQKQQVKDIFDETSPKRF